jgi:hypothetical protein
VTPVPIAASPDAVDWITEILMRAGELPGGAGGTPVLIVGANQTWFDRDGRVTEHCPGTFFDVGWYNSDDMPATLVLALGISGLKLRAQPVVLVYLRGKRLTLRIENTGRSGPARLKRPVLRAVTEPD